jgi:hypothetical protein
LLTSCSARSKYNPISPSIRCFFQL